MPTELRTDLGCLFQAWGCPQALFPELRQAEALVKEGPGRFRRTEVARELAVPWALTGTSSAPFHTFLPSRVPGGQLRALTRFLSQDSVGSG